MPASEVPPSYHAAAEHIEKKHKNLVESAWIDACSLPKDGLTDAAYSDYVNSHFESQLRRLEFQKNEEIAVLLATTFDGVHISNGSTASPRPGPSTPDQRSRSQEPRTPVSQTNRTPTAPPSYRTAKATPDQGHIDAISTPRAASSRHASTDSTPVPKRRRKPRRGFIPRERFSTSSEDIEESEESDDSYASATDCDATVVATPRLSPILNSPRPPSYRTTTSETVTPTRRTPVVTFAEHPRPASYALSEGSDDTSLVAPSTFSVPSTVQASDEDTELTPDDSASQSIEKKKKKKKKSKASRSSATSKARHSSESSSSGSSKASRPSKSRASSDRSSSRSSSQSAGQRHPRATASAARSSALAPIEESEVASVFEDADATPRASHERGFPAVGAVASTALETDELMTTAPEVYRTNARANDFDALLLVARTAARCSRSVSDALETYERKFHFYNALDPEPRAGERAFTNEERRQGRRKYFDRVKLVAWSHRSGSAQLQEELDRMVRRFEQYNEPGPFRF